MGPVTCAQDGETFTGRTDWLYRRTVVMGICEIFNEPHQPNNTEAESWMRDLARRFVDSLGLGGRAKLHMFQAPAMPDLPARYGLLVAEAGSELWL